MPNKCLARHYPKTGPDWCSRPPLTCMRPQGNDLLKTTSTCNYSAYNFRPPSQPLHHSILDPRVDEVDRIAAATGRQSKGSTFHGPEGCIEWFQSDTHHLRTQVTRLKFYDGSRGI
ncbi:hypothetical protein GCM10022235_81970 [Kribbella ginsengisoli]|uniref:Uncharacterized protein n=1 Tax=Kribbella ginsengisoli TaxID=363865 RepID=A0ABP6Z797_9ACTN